MSDDPGPVERALRLDLDRLQQMESRGRGTLAELALRMAQAIDGWEEDRSSSGLSALARAHQELRATLGALMEEVGDDGDDAAAGLPAPVWNGSKRPAHVGGAGGGGGGEAGEAAHAAPAGDR